MDNESLLRRALRSNALFSLASGGLAIALNSRVGELLSLPTSLITALGGTLVLFGVGLLVLASRARIASAWSVTVTALDLGWVVGSAVLIASHTIPSRLLVVVVAAIVLTFALLQLEGHRRALFTRRRGHYAIERTVNGSADRAWRVVSDVARFAEVAGTLHRSEIVSGSGAGMVRRCEDTHGVCWLETCTRWEEGRAYAFEVNTIVPGYPLPLKTMRGDFEVDSVNGARSMIRVRFTFVAKGGWPTELLLALVFATRGDILVGDILARWSQRIESLEDHARLHRDSPGGAAPTMDRARPMSAERDGMFARTPAREPQR